MLHLGRTNAFFLAVWEVPLLQCAVYLPTSNLDHYNRFHLDDDGAKFLGSMNASPDLEFHHLWGALFMGVRLWFGERVKVKSLIGTTVPTGAKKKNAPEARCSIKLSW